MCPEILEIRRLCNAHGMYSLQELAFFVCISPDKSQQEIARMSNQSDSSVGQWILKFQLWGLIETEMEPLTYRHGKKKGQTVMRVASIRHSEEGKALLLRIRGLLRSSHNDAPAGK